MTILEKSKIIGAVFVAGEKHQMQQEWIWGTAAVVGLMQSLKYKGSIKTGIIGGLAVVIVLAGTTGISNIALHWNKIKEVLKEKGE
jgi:hypothetical protein